MKKRNKIWCNEGEMAYSTIRIIQSSANESKTAFTS